MPAKVCAVCGDKALGFNFNVISCESCKAFFRRNALRRKRFSCAFNDSCLVSTKTRRFCPKCRLQKCMDIGMRCESIMTEEQKLRKRRKIERNRTQRQQAPAVDGNTSGYGSSSSPLESNTPLDMNPDLLCADELVASIVDNADCSAQVMNKIMRTPTEALRVIEKIFDSESNALRLVAHLMRFPGDALRMISKLTNTPLDAVSVLVKLFSAAKLALDIISMITAAPSLAVSFARKLLAQPQRACQMMQTFMARPGDALQEIKLTLEEIQLLSLSGNNEVVNINPIESMLSEVIQLEYDFTACDKQDPTVPSTTHSANALGDFERRKLYELQAASRALYDPLDVDLTALQMSDDRLKHGITTNRQQNSQILQLVNLSAVAMTRLVKMAKKIDAFRDLCQDDQIALLKGGCTEMMLIRSALVYDKKCNQWVIPHTIENMGNIRADLLKYASGNIYEEHQKFMSTFQENWRTDQNIILVMCAILLFEPNRAHVTHPDVISLQQNLYYDLLRRYLESIHSACEAKSAFAQLVQKIVDLRSLNKSVLNVYLNQNPAELEPLLCEIFDLGSP